jgi:hypothetical protein
VTQLNDDQIKHMVERFLQWNLPENFNPDGGISFEPVGNAGTQHEYKRAPVGTNLFDATQAEAMVRYMVEGMPTSTAKDLYEAYLLGCEDECISEPKTFEQFMSNWESGE